MNAKKTLLVLAVSSVLAACGGSSGSSTTGGTTGTTSTVSVTGTPTKGVMFGAQVTALQLVNGAFVAFSPALSTTTDATTGSYSLAIPTDYTGVVKITTVSVAGTTMLCDFAGCATGGVNFGDAVSLPAGFTMNAMVSGVSGTSVTINPNILTHLASELAEKTTITAASVKTAADNLARTYDIDGDLTSIASVDITSPAKVNAANQNAVLVNMISAAMMSTAFSQNSGGSFADALTVLTTDFVANDGALLEKDSTAAISKNDINQAMSDLLTSIKDKATTDGVPVTGLAGIEADVQEEKAELAAKPVSNSTRETIPVADPNAGASNLVKSKAMVTELRNLVNAIDMGISGEFSGLELGVEGFVNEIGAITITEAELDLIGEALAEAAEGIATAYNADDSQSEYTFTSSTVSGIASIDITASELTDWQDQSGTVTEKKSAKVVGTVVTDAGLTLTITEGSSMAYEYLDNSPTATDENLKDANLVLNATLSNSAASFNGLIDVSFNNFIVDQNDDVSSFDDASIFLSGVFSNNGESLNASFGMSFNGSEVTDTSVDDMTSGNFIKGAASLSFATTIPGVTGTDSAKVSIRSNNSTFDNGEVSLRIEYDTTDIKFTVDDAKAATHLVISNQNDVVLTVDQATNGDVSGDISVDGTKTADIVNGLITYTDAEADGYFESF